MLKKKPKKISYNKQWGESLISHLGGVKNIKTITHCLTRLRFIVYDSSMINDQAINSLENIKGTFKSKETYHVIIGVNVNYFYNNLINDFDLNNLAKKESKKDNKKNNFILKSINYLGEVFIPIIPVLVAGGIILGIRNIFEADFNGWIMVEARTFIRGLNDFLWIPAQACFWWLPVHICWSIFRKKKADEVLGIIIGLCMLVPPLINVYETVATGNKSNSTWIWDIINADIDKFTFNFGFMKYPWKIQYTAQVIPAFMVGLIGAHINLWIKKTSPGYLYQILVPIVTILPTFIIAMFVIGPLGFIIGSAISFVFKWAFTNAIAKYFFAFIIGGLYSPIVITGVHHMFNAIFVQNTIENGGNFLFIAGCIQAVSQGAAILGWIAVNRKDKAIKDVGIPGIVSAWLGVTEPAMYGINIRYMYPFIGACLGSAIGTGFAVMAGVSAYNSGNGAWLGILNVQAQSKIPGVQTWIGTGYVWFLVALLITVASAIVITILLSKVKIFKKYNIQIQNTDQLFKK